MPAARGMMEQRLQTGGWQMPHKLSEYSVFPPIPPSPPLGGEGRGEGERLRRTPLTLTLSPGGGEGIWKFYARS